MCDLIEKVKQIRSITEGLGGGMTTIRKRYVPLHICTHLNFFLKWEDLYKVSDSINVTLWILCRNVLEHKCFWSPCEMVHFRGSGIWYCDESFH